MKYELNRIRASTAYYSISAIIVIIVNYCYFFDRLDYFKKLHFNF